jgi:hypothetical protein
MRKTWLSVLCLGLLLAFAGAAQAQTQPCAQTIAPKLVSATAYTVNTTDRCGWILLTATDPVTISLPAPGLVFAPNFEFTVLPINGATVTFVNLRDPGTGLFRLVNLQSSLTLAAAQGAVVNIQQDMNWYALPTGKVEGSGSVTSITFNDGLTSTPNPVVAVGTAGMAPIPSLTALGNVGGVAAVPAALTKTQLTTLINPFTDALSGAVPASGGVLNTFLEASTHSFQALPHGSTTVFGVYKVDGTTITETGAVLSAVTPTGSCIVSGAAGIVLNNGSNGCTTDTSITAAGAALTIGSSGVAGGIFLGNATSGLGEIVADTGALGASVWTFPAASTKVPIIPQTITVTGPTAARTWTVPNSNMAIAALDIANQVVTGGFVVTSNNLGTISSGTLTVACGTRDLQYFTNNGAFTLAADSADGSCAYLMTNGASAGAVTLSGFTLVGGACDGSALTTVNTSKFKFYFTRINGVSDCAVKAYQ